jgi:hypothetical protein
MVGVPVPSPSGPPRRPGYQDFFDAAWVGSLFRPLLIALVAASVVGGPLALLHLFAASWRLDYALPFAFAVALEGVYSTLQLGRPAWRDRRGLVYRLGEILVLLALFRVVVWTFGTGWPGLAAVQTWLRQPAAFLDAQFVFLGIWMVIAWGLAVGMTGDFLDLALQPDEIAAHDSPLWGESRSQLRIGRTTSRSDILTRLVTRWTVGGILLVFFTSLSQVDLSLLSTGTLRLGISGLGLPPELLLALVCYFLAGLLLISQGRLAVLRGRWYNQDIEVQPVVLRRWHVNSLFAVLLIGVVAAFLPMGTTSWLSAALEAVLALVMRLGYLLIFLLTVLLALLLWPLRLLMQSGEPPPAPLSAAPEIPTQAEMASRLPDWLGGALLWLIVALIVIYFGLTYLGAHGTLRVRGRPADWLLRLRYWWRARWARIHTALQAAAAAVSQRVQLARARASAALQLPAVRVSALTPRERVRYFYLRMLGRAAERGLARSPHQTPAEFAQRLETEWPDAEVDVEALTTAFQAARYDRRPIPVQEAQGVQAIWRRLMRELRNRADNSHSG